MTGFINSIGFVYILIYCNSLDCFVPRNDGMHYLHCKSPSFSKKKSKMTTVLPTPSFRPKHMERQRMSPHSVISTEHMERQRNVCSGEICTAFKATCHDSTTQRSLQFQIPPLRMLRWRSARFGRNDGIRYRLCEPAKQSSVTVFSGLLRSSQWRYALTVIARRL